MKTKVQPELNVFLDAGENKRPLPEEWIHVALIFTSSSSASDFQAANTAAICCSLLLCALMSIFAETA